MNTTFVTGRQVLPTGVRFSMVQVSKRLLANRSQLNAEIVGTD